MTELRTEYKSISGIKECVEIPPNRVGGRNDGASPKSLSINGMTELRTEYKSISGIKDCVEIPPNRVGGRNDGASP